MSEIDDRVALGTQPQTLRPLSRPPISRGWLFAALGLDPSNVPLEQCLKPLPLMSIGGELLTGRPLRLLITRDRFRIGDGLARSLAASVREVTWSRHKAISDDGVVIKSGPPDQSYTPTADDVGSMLSAQWVSAAGVSLRAETAQIQPRPGLRDAVSGLLAAGKAAFDVTFLEKAAANSTHLAQPQPRPGDSVASARASAAGAPHREKHKGTVRIDAASRTVEVSWVSALSIRRTRAKPFSRHSRVTHSADSTTFELYTSARRKYLLRASSLWERDLLALTLRSFTSEFPTADMPTTPIMLEPVAIELVDADDIEAAVLASGELLTSPPMVADVLRATTPKALHATGTEFAWYRTTRNGVRTNIEFARSPVYSPTADDLGCLLTVEAVPYESLTTTPIGLASSLAEARDRSYSRPYDDRGLSDEDSEGSEESMIAPSVKSESPNAASRNCIWGKPATARPQHEVRLEGDLEARLHRLCGKGYAEFRVAMARGAATPYPHRQHVLVFTRSKLHLKAGWSQVVTWEYCEHSEPGCQPDSTPPPHTPPHPRQRGGCVAVASS